MPRIVVDVPSLHAAWNDHSLTVTEVARKCHLTTGQLYAIARQHGLPKRPKQKRAYSFEEAECPEDEAASGNSLALAPAVQRRILELGIGYGR